tara:strand:- start:897 stop:1076 length:180 start_codon:yes stop_codon:yes gene_type:complete
MYYVFLGGYENIPNKGIIKRNTTLKVNTYEISPEIGGFEDAIDKKESPLNLSQVKKINK